MSFYSGLALTTQRLIADKGRVVTLRRATRSYDAGTDIYTETSTTFGTKAIFTEFKQNEIDGTLIMRGDKKVLLAALDVEPQPNDVLVDGVNEYRIIEIMEVRPGDTAILYKVQVRK